jgi:hypothetical protein
MKGEQRHDMPNESELKSEIGHVLFIDIVGYSPLSSPMEGKP